MIRLENISKVYHPKTSALKNVDLHIKEGEFVFLIGQSGSGKTTLVRLVNAEERPTRGTIMIGDQNISRIKRGDVPYLRRQIGVIYQDFKLLEKKTVEENVAFALEVCGEKGKTIRSVVPQV